MKFAGQSGVTGQSENKRKEAGNLAHVSPKLLIRNLPFEANKNEIRELFKYIKFLSFCLIFF